MREHPRLNPAGDPAAINFINSLATAGFRTIHGPPVAIYSVRVRYTVRSSDEFRRTAKSGKPDGPVTSPNGVVYANQAAMDYWMPVLERKATATPMAPAA